jgi:nucleotide-binding universal stress UspA family protein
VADTPAQATPKKRLEPYFFDPKFERAVALLACRSARFYGRVGKDVDPDALGCDEAKLALRAARDVAKDNGRGPGNLVVALQRLRSWVEDGKLAPEDVEAVGDYFDAAEDAGVPPEDDVVAELAKLLKKRMKGEIARQAAADYAAGNDFGETKKKIAQAEAVGGADLSVGMGLGAEAIEAIEAESGVERLSTGILDLDAVMNGGRRFGTLMLYIGGPGVGKSMQLIQESCSDIRQGLFVAYATLEVPVIGIMARHMANLTGAPIDAILADPHCVDRIMAQMKLGPLRVQAFAAHVTTGGDIAEWVGLLEQKHGRKVDCVKIDYLDRLTSRSVSRKDGSYALGEACTQDLWDYANAEGVYKGKSKRWVSSASAATRKKDKRNVVTSDDVADSMHKSRITDTSVSINRNDDGFIWHIAKNRYGKDGVSVGPIPHELECGRTAPIVEAVVSDEAVDAYRAARMLGGSDAVKAVAAGKRAPAPPPTDGGVVEQGDKLANGRARGRVSARG